MSCYPDNLTFSTLAEISYTEYAAVVFALEIQHATNQEKSVIRLHPANFVFKKSDGELFNYYLYIICEDGEIAEQISVLQMAEEKFERNFGKPRENLNDTSPSKATKDPSK